MTLQKICAPALLYLVFSTVQILIDLFKNLYNTAFFKFIITIIFTILLNILCSQGLGIISWFIVFVPFISMTIITAILLFVFGLDPASGSLDYSVEYPGQKPPPKPKPQPKPQPQPQPQPQPHSSSPHSSSPHSSSPHSSSPTPILY